MLFPQWRKLLSSLFRSTNRMPYHKARSQRRNSAKPRLEGLEDRCLLSIGATLIEGANGLTLDLHGDTVAIAGNTTSLVFTDETSSITVIGSTWTTAGNNTSTVTVNGTTSPNLNSLTINDSTGAGVVFLGDGINAIDLSAANTALLDGGASNPNSTDLLSSVSTGAGNQTYNTTILPENAGISLTANTVTFNADVLPFDQDLTVDGTTDLNAGNVNTGRGRQTYNGAVSLGANATLTGSSVTFDNTVDSANSTMQSLTITGNAIFDGNVGGVNPLNTLSVNAGNPTTLFNDVTTSGNQTYSGSVTLGQSSTLDSTNGDISVTDGVTNSAGVGGTVTLAVVDGGGSTPSSIGGAVTDNSSFPTSLTALTLTAGTLTLSGANTYTGDTTLTGGTLKLGSSTVGNTGPIGTGTLILQGGDLQASGAAQSIANSFTVNGGALISGSLGLTLSGDGTLNSTFTVDNNAATTFRGAERHRRPDDEPRRRHCNLQRHHGQFLRRHDAGDLRHA